MTINNIEFDDIEPTKINKRNYREYEEGKRLKVKELWVDSYPKIICDGCFKTEYWAHKITLNNYGTITFDDKPVKNEKEIKWVKDLFASIKV